MGIDEEWAKVQAEIRRKLDFYHTLDENTTQAEKLSEEIQRLVEKNNSLADAIDARKAQERDKAQRSSDAGRQYQLKDYTDRRADVPNAPKYQQETPAYEPPQPSYTPSMSQVTWDDEEDEEGTDEWDEEDDEDTEEEEEEEDYRDEQPAFVSPPSARASTPRQQGSERHQPEGGKWRLGRDIRTGGYVDAPQAGRKEGLYIIGATGTGKTGLIENLIIQDIKQGLGVGLFDPHGDLINAVLARMDRREDDVILLDITDYHYPFGLNLFACSDLTNPIEVQKTVDQVMHIFDRLFDITRTTPLIIQYLRNCTHTLVANPGYTMADIPLLLRNKDCRSRLVAKVRDRNVLGFWQEYDDMKPSDQRAEREPILRRLEELLQPLTFNIVGQSTTTVDIKQVMDKGKILLVKLSAQLPYVTSLIGSILIALFLNAAYARPANKRRQFNLYADEFQRFATEDFATLLTEARKFGIATTIAHQARYQPGMTDGIRATSLSAKNLVVFKVNSKDGDDLAGEFDITPQEAWEQEIEPERIKVLRPQRHKRIEEQVVVEVEEDVMEIPTNPFDYLVSTRGTHVSVKVQDIVQRLFVYPEKRLIPLEKEAMQQEKIVLHTLLTTAMKPTTIIRTQPFADMIVTLVKCHFYNNTTWERFSHEYEFIQQLVLNESASALKNTYIQETLASEKEKHILYLREHYISWIGMVQYDVLTNTHRTFTADMVDPTIAYELNNRDAFSFLEGVREHLKKEIDFVLNLITLCEELHANPIRVSTGQKRMVKRIQPHITYLTEESEKLTIPRKTIMHPQRTYADMLNEVASQLTNLDNFMAKVRYINADARLVECTIRTLDPKKDPDRPLFGQALQERIARIQAHNRTPQTPGSLPYCRSRQEVEAEIRQRQEQCSQPPPEPPKEPPISRRPQR